MGRQSSDAILAATAGPAPAAEDLPTVQSALYRQCKASALGRVHSWRGASAGSTRLPAAPEHRRPPGPRLSTALAEARDACPALEFEVLPWPGSFVPLASNLRLSVLNFCVVCAVAPACFAQPNGPQGASQEIQNKRIFWIIPNYRTYPTLSEYQPMSTRRKFKIAVDDSFDRGTFVLAGLFAGQRQLVNNTPSFGQGVPGFGRYFSTAYADLVIGDFMTEAIYPSLLHQDPRYFRRGTGSAWSRAGYAVSQIFWTHMDSGGHQFNFAEVGGNATAVAIANAYYPDNRTAQAAISGLGVQLGIDMAGNLLKEFWPDLSRKFSRKPHDIPLSIEPSHDDPPR